MARCAVEGLENIIILILLQFMQFREEIYWNTMFVIDTSILIDS